MKKVFFIVTPIFLTLVPVLLLGQTFLNSDALYLHIPNLEFYSQSLKSGESFFWNPFIVSGFPSFASLVGGLFSPLNLLLFWGLMTLNAHSLAIFINLVLAGLFTAWFLKRLGLSFYAQILGALTFVFSQWFIVSDLGIVNSFPILPLMFLLILESREKYWPIVVGGLVLGWMFLSAHYNWILMILVAVSFFALYLGRKVLAKLIGMGLIGVLIGLVQIYPAYIFSRLAVRGSESLSFADSQVGAFNIWDFPKLFLPYFRLPLVENAEQLLFVGLIPLFFIIVSFGVRGESIRFFKWTFLVALLLGVKFSALFWLLHQLPVLSTFRGPSRWMFIGFFAASVLAAFGLDRYREVAAWKLKWTKVFIVLGTLVLVASIVVSLMLIAFTEPLIAFLQDYFANNLYAETSGLPLDHYNQAIVNLVNDLVRVFGLANPGVLASLVFLFLSILAVFAFAFSELREKYFNKKGLVFLTAANFVLVFVFFHPVLPREAITSVPKTLELISEDSGKVISFLPGQSEWNKLTVPFSFDPTDSYEFNSAMLAPSVNAYYGVASADSYENLMPRRQARLLALLGSDRATVGERLVDLDVTPEEKAEIFADRKHLLDILGVRYVISAYRLDETVFEMVGEMRATRHDIPVYVYENEEARKEVYLSSQGVVIEQDEQRAYQETLERSRESVDVVECADCTLPEVFGRGEIKVLEKSTESMLLSLELDRSGLVVFTQSHLPGWQAWIDGSPVSIYTVNSVFMGLIVPEGSHEVKFEYRFKNILIQN